MIASYCEVCCDFHPYKGTEADLDERGQKLSKQPVRVEQRALVARLVSSDETRLGGGSEYETIEDRREGECAHRLHRKVTHGAVYVV